jgi:lysine 2,3-aminomutase
MGAAVSLRVLAPRAKKNPRDWRWQLRNAITTAEGLARAMNLTAREMEGALRAERAGLPIAITPYYASLISREDPADPVRAQCVPDARESEISRGDLVDPLGEEAHTVAEHLVRRYPDRVLLLVSDRCAVYCRFCTRSRMVGQGGGAISLDAMKPALDWIRSHDEIRDVIVSGGDPLAMSTEKIERIVSAIRSLAHVETIRIATRVPVTLPMRITRELVRALAPHHPLWVMTHFNHPHEITAQSRRACAMLADAGFPVMNQTVLLRGVNDDARTLEALFRGLVRMRVRPYYLLQMDPVRGSAHMRTPLARGVEIMRELQGRVSGIALPKFVCDTPGGKGKVILAPDAIVARDAHGKRTTLRTFRGEDVDYIDP